MNSNYQNNILLLTDDLNYNCGVTTFLYNHLISLSTNRKYNFILICTGGNSIDRFRNMDIGLFINTDFKFDKRSLLRFLKSIFFLLIFVKKNKIDLIHSQNHYVSNISFIVSKIINVKTLQSHHNLYKSRGILPHFISSKHIAVSKRIKEFMISQGILEGDISLILYGVKIKQLTKKKSEKLNILLASRLIPEKSVNDYIIAVSQIPDYLRKDVNFYLAGDGSEKNDLLELNTKLNSGIIFLGLIKNMIELLNKTQISLMTSSWDAEGYPLTLIEAGLTKNLVITSDFPGYDEIFEDGVDGFVYKCGNQEDLSQKLIYAIKNFNKLNDRITNFSEKVNRIFNYDNMIRNLSELYDEILI